MESVKQWAEPENAGRFEPLARKALLAYGLQDAELRLLAQSRNVVFRVQTDEGRWVLRICDPNRDRTTLMRELLWLAALGRDTELGVPEPVIAKSGELVRGVSMRGLSGFHPCMLLRWVKGQFVDEWTEGHLRDIGRLTARLHRHAVTFHWPEEMTSSTPLTDRTARLTSPAVLRAIRGSSDADALRSAIPVIQQVLRVLGGGRDTAGAVHGALGRANVLFCEGDARAIGFDTVSWNVFAYDVAATFSDLGGRSDADELKRAYLEGYAEIRPLPCDPDVHLPALDVLHAWWGVAQRLEASASREVDGLQNVLAAALRKTRQLLALQ